MNYLMQTYQPFNTTTVTKLAALLMAAPLLLFPSATSTGDQTNLVSQTASQIDHALEVAYAEVHDLSLEEAAERRGLESRNLERGKRYAGSGGYFLDSDGVLVVDAANSKQASLLTTQFSDGIEAGEVRVRISQFTMSELKEKREAVINLAASHPRVFLEYGIDVESNSVAVNLSEESSVLSESGDYALSQEIDALVTDEGYTVGVASGEFVETANTIDSGNKVKFGSYFSGGFCTVGPQIQFNDVSDGYGFLTNAHCTRGSSFEKVRVWYSPNSNEDVGYVAQAADVNDPHDVASIRYDVTNANNEPLTGSPTLYLNGVNKTTNPGTVTGYDEAVVGETVCIRGSYSGYRCAETLNIDWSRGFNYNGETVTRSDNILTSSIGRNGDSGSSLFRVDKNNNITILGLYWGTNCRLYKPGVCYSAAVHIDKALALANATLVTG